MYSVKFVDDTIFVGGNPNDSKWNDIPNKLIKELQYDYLGKEITLINFEAYNHIVKYGYRLDSQLKFMNAVILMVREGNNVKRFIFDFIKNELIIDVVNYGLEYNNKHVSGWKTGLIGEKSLIKIN